MGRGGRGGNVSPYSDTFSSKPDDMCCNCISWDGPVEENIDHSHCKDPRMDHKTLSKHGDKNYDHCTYFGEK